MLYIEKSNNFSWNPKKNDILRHIKYIMAYWLDAVHEKIIKFLRENSCVELTLMDIWKGVWLDHSQKVLNKLDQLEKKWYIRKNFESKTYDVLDEPIKDTVQIPMYGLAQCGNKGSDILHETPIKMVWFDRNIFWIKDQQKYILVQAKWDSMEPDVQEGSSLLVYLQKDFLDHDMVLVVHQGKLKVKNILRIGKEICLFSLNPKHEPIRVFESDNLDIIGVVKKVISNP